MAELQLIFVVETSSDDKTDNIYLRTVLNHFFTTKSKEYGCEVNTQTIFLNGKQHYKDKKVLSNIANQTRMFASYNDNAITKTIFIIDTDSTNKAYEVGSFFYNVQQFCLEHDFELVWFCKNAENVFLGKEVDQIENKTEAAKSFAKNNEIEKLDINCLSKSEIEYKCSNILSIIGKYLKEKIIQL